MGNGLAGVRWAKFTGVVLLGLLSVACDQAVPKGSDPNGSDPNGSALNEPAPDESAPNGVTPGNAPNAAAPNSMALDATPQAPPTDDDLSAPPPPPPGAFLAQLSPDQVAQLTSLGIDVVVPGTVPPAFQVADLRISQGDMGLSYLIVYQNANSQCFAVEYADGGTSPPPATEARVPINPPLFTDGDYGLNYGKFADPDWQSKFPEPNLYTDWLAGPSGYYRLTGAADIKALFDAFGACKDIDPQTAIDLVESFTLMTTEPMGTMF